MWWDFSLLLATKKKISAAESFYNQNFFFNDDKVICDEKWHLYKVHWNKVYNYL